MVTTTEPAPAPLLLRIPDVAQRLALGRSTVYELIATGQLPTVRIGRSVRVPVAALQSFVEHQITRSAVISTEPSGGRL